MYLLSELLLVANVSGGHFGVVTISSKFRYAVISPFGAGYKIQVSGKGCEAELVFSRDYAGAEVETPRGRYEMSDTLIYNAQGVKVAELKDGTLVTSDTYELLIAIFVVNHHFWKKTGPFIRPQ